AGGRPVLGICVGLQVMFDAGDEHGQRSTGLAQWPGEVTRLEADVVPHMGWNTVEPPAGTLLFDGVADQRFYFVHSYAARRWEMEPIGPMTPPMVTWPSTAGTASSPPSRTVRCARPSSTPRSPGPPVPRCWPTGCAPCPVTAGRGERCSSRS